MNELQNPIANKMEFWPFIVHITNFKVRKLRNLSIYKCLNSYNSMLTDFNWLQFTLKFLRIIWNRFRLKSKGFTEPIYGIFVLISFRILALEWSRYSNSCNLWHRSVCKINTNPSVQWLYTTDCTRILSTFTKSEFPPKIYTTDERFKIFQWYCSVCTMFTSLTVTSCQL